MPELGDFLFPARGYDDRAFCGWSKAKQSLDLMCGIDFTLHDLRRTFITIAESLDIPAYSLKRLLNHRGDTDVTSGYIIHNAERLRGPTDRIAAKILELVNADRIA